MKTGCEIKMIETQSDVILENKFRLKKTVQWRNFRAIVLYRNKIDVK